MYLLPPYPLPSTARRLLRLPLERTIQRQHLIGGDAQTVDVRPRVQLLAPALLWSHIRRRPRRRERHGNRFAQPGHAYFILYLEATPVYFDIAGDPLTTYTRELGSGWQTIGSVYDFSGVPIIDVVDVPTNSIEDICYGLNPITGSYYNDADSDWLTLKYYEALRLATPSLGFGVVGFFYNQTLIGEAGAPPYAWSLVSGSLPDGLTLNSSTGEISGTPTTEGHYSFTIQVSDEKLATVSRPFTIDIHTFPTIIHSSLLTGMTNIPYSQNLSAENGVPPYQWSISAGNLPNGLSLDQATGEISGIPTSLGTYNFTVTVSDTNLSSDTQPFTISVVYTPPIIGTSSLEFGVATSYNKALQVSGGLAPFTWSIISGTLPDGLTLNSATGEISGTPTVHGVFHLILQITDAASHSVTKGLTITISQEPNEEWTTSYNGGSYDLLYGMTLDDSGNIYATGTTYTEQGKDVLTIKYDGDGNELWARVYAPLGDEFGQDVAVDSSGNVYVTGYSSLNSDDWLIIKYDSLGNVVWTRSYGGGRV